MQYITYQFSPLARELQWEYSLYDKNNYPVYFKNTESLMVSGGGAVASYAIDDDYIVCNNSQITITQPTSAVSGQIIALINDSGAYDLGVIVSVDNKKLQILYKSFMELFNDNIINPFTENYQYDSINETGLIIAQNFTGVNVDKYRRIPMAIRVVGGGKDGAIYKHSAIWEKTDNSINVKTWLLELFDTQNIVISPRLIFEVDRSYIEIIIYQNAKGNFLIKNDVKSQTIQDIQSQSATATVCDVINKDKVFLERYFLLSDNTVSTNKEDSNRVQPFKLTIAELDDKGNTTPPTTAKIAAEQALLYKNFSTYCKVKIDKNSSMFPFGIEIGDRVNLIPIIEEMKIDTPIVDTSKHIINTIYTGKKESSGNNIIELTFGKIRINYTDIIQIENQKKVRT